MLPERGYKMAQIGLKNLVVAPLTAATAGSVPTYGAGKKVGHIMRANLNWNRGNIKLYGDDVLVEQDNSITSGELTVGTTYLDIDARVMITQDEKFGTPETGDPQLYATPDSEAPMVGCGFVTKDSADGASTKKFTGWWYYKVQFSLNEPAETRGESTQFNTPELVGEVMAVQPDADMKNRFRVYAVFDSETAAIEWVNAWITPPEPDP